MGWEAREKYACVYVVILECLMVLQFVGTFL